MSYQVDQPYSVNTQEVDGGVIYSETPMKVSDPQFAVPPIITGGIDFFKQFMAEPAETAGGIASAVGTELKEYPARQLRTALAGGETFNPETGEIERFDPFAVPATVGAGTAVSIARTAGKFGDGPVLGIMGGRRAQTGSAREVTAKSLKAMGKSEDDIFRANKAFFDSDVLGSDVDSFRFEIPTKNSSLNPDVVGEVDISYGSGTAFGLKEGTPSGFFTEDGNLSIDPAVSKITRLGDVLDFEELYTEYPEMRGVEVIRIVPSDLNNPFAKTPEAFFANADESPTGAPLIGIKNTEDAKTFQSRVLHEAQHAVQNIEGIPRGGSAKEIFDQLAERYPEVNEGLLQAKAIDLYKTLYGETEARVVQNRFENPNEALLNPVASRRKEMADTDVSMDELDAVDRVDEADFILDMIREPRPTAPKSTGLLGGDNPKTFYHGTTEAYEDFEVGPSGAVYLSENPGYAEEYAGFVGEFKSDRYPEFNRELRARPGSNIRPVHVKNNLNMFDADNPEHLSALEKFGYNLDEVPRNYPSPYDETLRELIQVGEWELMEEIAPAIKEAGFDGYRTVEGGNNTLAIFDPKNLVSATAKKAEGGIVSLLDVARNTGRGPRGVASLVSTARNMNRPMVS